MVLVMVPVGQLATPVLMPQRTKALEVEVEDHSVSVARVQPTKHSTAPMALGEEEVAVAILSVAAMAQRMAAVEVVPETLAQVQPQSAAKASSSSPTRRPSRPTSPQNHRTSSPLIK
jgi:hypothetical protein